MKIKFKKKLSVTLSALVISLGMIPTSFADTTGRDLNINQGIELAGASENMDPNDSIEDENLDGIQIQLGLVDIDKDGNIDSSGQNSSDQLENDLEIQEKLTSDNQKTAGNVTYLSGSDRYGTAIKISQKGWSSGARNVVLVNSGSTISGTIATPLATTYNAPILLSGANYINSSTIREIRRLKPSKVYLIGNTGSLSANVEQTIKSMGIVVKRLSGTTIGQTSAKIAGEIAKNHKVSTSYVVSTQNGSADALSIAAQAGRTKSPVLVSSATAINSEAIQFMKNNTSNVYYIGGTGSISTGLLKRISANVANGGEANRIYGSDRHDTNIKIIKKFFGNGPYAAISVAKSDDIGMIDTAAAGPLAAKKNTPLLITKKDRIQNVTKNFITNSRANSIIQIGGGFSSAVSGGIQNALFGRTVAIPVKPTPPSRMNDEVVKPISTSGGIRGKTIIIDPGHGGKDPGAIGLNGYREKDWTLVTSMACADYLRRAGADVVMTRTNDIYPTLQERADLSNSKNGVLFCSIHYNKGGNLVNANTGELSGNGVEVFAGEGSFTKNVANKVLNNILSSFNLRNRGVKDGSHLYVIANTNAPAILVEGGFMSSSKDVGQLASKAAQQRMGVQIAKGIISSFN